MTVLWDALVHELERLSGVVAAIPNPMATAVAYACVAAAQNYRDQARLLARSPAAERLPAAVPEEMVPKALVASVIRDLLDDVHHRKAKGCPYPGPDIPLQLVARRLLDIPDDSETS
jgi:hypothetical protein